MAAKAVSHDSSRMPLLAAPAPDPTVTKTAAVASTRLESANGIYQGALQDGKPHGQGTYEYLYHPEGRKKYTGTFKDGLPDGKGKLEWTHGSVYEGLFSNGEPHGNGKLTTSAGAEFEGPFVNGNMHGLFRYFAPNQCCYDSWTTVYYENDKETFHCDTCCTIL